MYLLCEDLQEDESRQEQQAATGLIWVFPSLGEEGVKLSFASKGPTPWLQDEMCMIDVQTSALISASMRPAGFSLYVQHAQPAFDKTMSTCLPTQVEPTHL